MAACETGAKQVYFRCIMTLYIRIPQHTMTDTRPCVQRPCVSPFRSTLSEYYPAPGVRAELLQDSNPHSTNRTDVRYRRHSIPDDPAVTDVPAITDFPAVTDVQSSLMSFAGRHGRVIADMSSLALMLFLCVYKSPPMQPSRIISRLGITGIAD